jgi:hypothetical protein
MVLMETVADLRAYCRPVPENLPRGAAIWFEVENFLRCFDHFAHVTGIQRACLEIFAAVEEQYGGTDRLGILERPTATTADAGRSRGPGAV